MEQSPGDKVLVTYNDSSTGRKQVYGASTKTYYGYRKKGDQFMAFRADIAARPTLLVPVDQRDRPTPVVGMRGRTRQRPQSPIRPGQPLPQRQPAQSPPPPPTPWAGEESVVQEVSQTKETVAGLDAEIRSIDWDGRLNKGQVRTLYQNNVRTLADAVNKGKAGLVKIKGIGEKIADTLLEEASQRSSE